MVTGKRLRALRKEKALESNMSLTCADVAKAIDVSPSAMYMYERAERMPPPDRLVALADYYEVTVDYLLGRGPRTYGRQDESEAQRDRALRGMLRSSGATNEDISFIMALLDRRRLVGERDD